MTFRIRPAATQDIPTLAAVERSAATLFLSLPNPPDIQQTVPTELLADMLASGWLWVATDHADQPAGFIACRALGTLLYIYELSVAASAQRHGLGRRLMQTAIAAADAAGFAAMGLTTRRDAPWSYQLYLQLGFTDLTDHGAWPELATQLAQEQAAGGIARCAMVKPLGAMR